MKGGLKRLDDWTNTHRPWALLGVVAITVATVAFLNWATGSDLYDKLFEPVRDTVKDVRFWSALVYALAFAMGLPVAFLLWHWRDRNVRDGIENARKDINLKEFQEVQLRAAGALDEKLPAEAREQLQIAALHQLRGFLRGEYGESFKRPAFELLLAGHAAAVHRIGVPEVQAQLSGRSREQIREAVAALTNKLTPIDRTRMLIIRDESAHIFTPDFPLDGRRFDLLDLSGKWLPRFLDLRSSHFFGANLQKIHLEGADLSSAHLEAADVHWARFEGTLLRTAHLEGAQLSGAHLEAVDLRFAHLEYANLRQANIDYRTQCDNAKFNWATQFGTFVAQTWSDFSVAEREAARAPWIARGMINVDAPVFR